MKTVKEILAEQKAEEEIQREKERKQFCIQKEQETKELDEARDKLAKALEGFDYVESEDNYGRQFKILFGARSVFIIYTFEDHQTRYSDDTDYVDVRSLSVKIGFIINQPSQITSVESFPESFAKFLKRERLA